MSDMERRSEKRMTRSARADRAYTLVKVTGGLTVATVVLIVLAVVGVIGGGWAFITAVLAVVSGLLLRKTLNP